MELKETKFKQTEIGLIPEDWEIIVLGEKFTIKNGLNKAKEYFGYGTPIVNYMDVFNNSGIYKSLVKGKVFVSYQEKENYKIKLGDLLFTRTSETPNEIGLSSVILEEITDAVFSGFVLRARPKDDTFNNEFKKYCFRSNEVRQQIISSCSYTTRALTNGKSLSVVLIPKPPLPEQKTIAQVLSDTDNLIQAIEQKLVKKRGIKQGAMQRLLMPKEDWEVKKLGEILKVKHGKSQKKVEDKNGIVPILGTGGLMGYSNQSLYNRPSVLIGRKGTIDKPQYLEIPFWTVDTLFYTEIFEEYHPKFIFYIFNLIDWYAHNEASGVPSLNAKTIENIEKYFPEIKEQTRIANILSDMDAEIAQLEQKLSKYKMVKQGLMQNLLTGKIRLV